MVQPLDNGKAHLPCCQTLSLEVVEILDKYTKFIPESVKREIKQQLENLIEFVGRSLLPDMGKGAAGGTNSPFNGFDSGILQPPFSTLSYFHPPTFGNYKLFFKNTLQNSEKGTHLVWSLCKQFIDSIYSISNTAT